MVYFVRYDGLDAPLKTKTGTKASLTLLFSGKYKTH